MKAEIKGGNLIITVPFDEKGKASSSGKSLVHATSSGNRETEVKVNGKPLYVGVNAYTSTKA